MILFEFIAILFASMLTAFDVSIPFVFRPSFVERFFFSLDENND